jgi:hypothetical protein
MADRKRVQSFRDLLVWRKGIELAEAVYALTRIHELQKMRHSLRSRLGLPR